MAKIIGFTYGELRGKIGGTVFSRNKAGAYARARVTPVNPQTVRQQTARYSFGNNSILFQALSGSVKDCWETFARTHFNPLKGNSTGIYSGGNAFVALRSSVNQGNNYRLLPTVTSGVTAVTATAIAYSLVSDPPAQPSSSTIIASDNVAYPINVENIEVLSNGNFKFSVVPQGVPAGSSATFDALRNQESQLFGIGLYASNNLKFEGAKPNTALKINFGDTGVINSLETTTGAAPLPITNGLIVESSSVVNKDNTRDFPCEGDYILVTPFIRTIDGAQKLMSPQYVQVAANFS
jgi:hypothetical protein